MSELTAIKCQLHPPAETSQADVNVLFQNIVQEKQIEISRKGLWMQLARWSVPQWQRHCIV